MDILLLLTTAGSDTGPLFDLYENSTGPFVLFESDVPKVDLTTPPGHPTTVLPGTTQVRVLSKGVCPNYIDIVLESTTTTTTTTSLPYSVFVIGFQTPSSPYPIGWSDGASACSAPSSTPIPVYTQSGDVTFQDIITNGHVVYADSGLTTPYNGQGTWFKTLIPSENKAIRIDTDGVVSISLFSC
jgi:hypothetical protein